MEIAGRQFNWIIFLALGERIKKLKNYVHNPSLYYLDHRKRQFESKVQEIVHSDAFTDQRYLTNQL